MTFERPLSYQQLDLFEISSSEPVLSPPIAVEEASAMGGVEPAQTTAPASEPEPEPMATPLGQAPPTFAEAEMVLKAAADMTPAQRRDQISALNCVASKILHAPLANIPCCPAYLNGALFAHPPSAFKMGRSSFSTQISRLRAVLRRVGTHHPHELGERTLSAAWQEFLGHIKVAGLFAGLRRFARYCDGAKIQPISVNDAVLADFLTFDRNGRLSAAHAEQGANLASAWRTAIRSQRTPERFSELKAPRRRQPYTLPISAYPPEFQASVEAYRRAVGRIERPSGSLTLVRRGNPESPMQRRPGPFTAKPARRFRRLKPSSVETRVFSMRQAAAALVLQGVPIAEITSLASLVQPVERAQQIISFYFDRADGVPGSQTEAIAVTLHQIAKHHVQVPDDDLEQIADWRDEVSAERTGEMCAKARKCILELWQPRPRAILLSLPEILEEQSHEDTISPVEQARMMRAAVLIEILLRCPLRIGNLHELRLDSHLTYLGGARHPSHILLKSNETKNDNAISFPIPDDAARLIQRYLDRTRPLLAQPGNPYLFPGEAQGPLSVNQARHVFKGYVEGATGVAVYPHAMRHFAGRLFLAHHPGQYEILQRILGHRDVKTTKDFYTGLETDMAYALSDAALLEERSSGRNLARAALSKLSIASPRRSPRKG